MFRTAALLAFLPILGCLYSNPRSMSRTTQDRYQRALENSVQDQHVDASVGLPVVPSPTPGKRPLVVEIVGCGNISGIPCAEAKKEKGRKLTHDTGVSGKLSNVPFPFAVRIVDYGEEVGTELTVDKSACVRRIERVLAAYAKDMARADSYEPYVTAQRGDFYLYFGWGFISVNLVMRDKAVFSAERRVTIGTSLRPTVELGDVAFLVEDAVADCR